jgi:predicted NBD/HSP70 family sugar kinase
LKGKIFRIGHLGWFDVFDITTALAAVELVLADAGADVAQVTGVGMGLPGPLRGDSGEVGDSAILPGWIGSRPEQLMRAELGLAVRVENDANLGALAEIVWGAGRGCSDLLYVKVATGVGAGLVLAGQPYRAPSGLAGEIGHVTVDERGPLCQCGSRGCLETVAGAEAMLSRLRGSYGERLTLDDVAEEARQAQIGSLDEVQWAVVETSGNISFIKKGS